MTIYLHKITDEVDFVSLVNSFSDTRNTILLDSASNVSEMGNYSYITSDPFILIESSGHETQITRHGISEILTANPWDVLQDMLSKYSTVQNDISIPFQGGAVGYWTYDLGRIVEELPTIADKEYDYPEMSVGFYDWVLVKDHNEDSVTLLTSDYNSKITPEYRKKWVLDRINNFINKPFEEFNFERRKLESNFTLEEYVYGVEAVKKYLEAGDIYQANISQRFSIPFEGDPWKLYLKLRESNPGAFSAYIATSNLKILSSSPELFISLNGSDIKTRPIKGTHPRSIDIEEDKRLSNQLVNSVKDQAENVMIVDLMRNDLGKVSSIGSVEVTNLFELEGHPTVWHLVSTIESKLNPRYKAVELLRQCFPGGSITGAPKIRAMEIIEELEPSRRGVYCGSIGYIGFNGNMSTNIAIRTMTLENNTIVFHSGGGIVSDSDPINEYDETIDKARGLLNALDIEL